MCRVPSSLLISISLFSTLSSSAGIWSSSRPKINNDLRLSTSRFTNVLYFGATHLSAKSCSSESSNMCLFSLKSLLFFQHALILNTLHFFRRPFGRPYTSLIILSLTVYVTLSITSLSNSVCPFVSMSPGLCSSTNQYPLYLTLSPRICLRLLSSVFNILWSLALWVFPFVVVRVLQGRLS